MKDERRERKTELPMKITLESSFSEGIASAPTRNEVELSDRRSKVCVVCELPNEVLGTTFVLRISGKEKNRVSTSTWKDRQDEQPFPQCFSIQGCEADDKASVWANTF